MAWRDDLRPASFRRVPFFVESARTEQGLNADEHTFPGRARAEQAIRVQHLGQGPRRYRIEAFVVGADYLERRDALEQALLEPGSGRLVHPYRGERTVAVVGTVQTTESKARAGHAKIVFQVVDVSESGLRRRSDSQAIAERDLDSWLEDQARDFDSELADTEGVSDLYDVASRDVFSEAQDALRQAHDAIAQVTGTISDFDERVGAFAADLAAFASAPGAAARALQGAIGAVLDLPGEVAADAASSLAAGRSLVDDVLGAARELLDFGDDLPRLPTHTPGQTAEVRRRDAVAQVTRGAALAHVSRAALALPYTSRAHALRVRESLADDYDAFVGSSTAAGATVSGALLYEALRTARVSVERHLARVAAELPELRTYEVPVAQPALVIAHELYGDARREVEVVTRNAPRHPGRIPAGAALEVLRE